MSEERTWTYCNRCGHDTWHDICAGARELNYPLPWDPDPEELAGFVEDGRFGTHDELVKRIGNMHYILYQIVRCRGCEYISFLLSEHRPWEPAPRIDARYPRAIIRRAPSWINVNMPMTIAQYARDYVDGDEVKGLVPEVIRHLMREVYEAVHNNSRRLAAMGIRTVLDIVFHDKVKDIGGFDKKLLELQKAGYLSLRQAGTLDTVLEVGHAAIHRGWEPSNDDINTSLDIAENLIAALYLHEPAAARLDKKSQNDSHKPIQSPKGLLRNATATKIHRSRGDCKVEEARGGLRLGLFRRQLTKSPITPPFVPLPRSCATGMPATISTAAPASQITIIGHRCVRSRPCALKLAEPVRSAVRPPYTYRRIEPPGALNSHAISHSPRPT